MRPIILITLAAAGLCAAVPGVAQHEYDETDIERGGQFYNGNCVGCHGPDGNLVEDVSLTDPVFLQNRTDEQLIDTIINGVEGTTMLANDYSALEAGYIVAYLRDLSARGRTTPQGDVAAGRSVFESLDCLDCHRVGRRGSRLGPNLSRIGLLRRTAELEEALLDPGATVLPANRYVRLVTPGGETVTGRLLNHDYVTAQLIDEEERLRLFNKADLQSFEILQGSDMPSYAEDLSGRELEDLLTYLVSLGRGEIQ